MTNGRTAGGAEEFQQGGQYEVNPMGDPVNPNHPGVGPAQVAAGTLLVAGTAVVAIEGVTGGLASQAPKLAKGVTNPEVGKAVFPKIGELSTAEVGKVIGWGSKPAGTMARIESVTAQEVAAMQRSGIDRQAAQQIRDFYSNEVARNANNATAQYRVQLMDKIMGLMK